MSAFPVILSAPSGGGKTTIARRLMERRGDVGYSVSCTTRQPREGEVSGRDYYFISRLDFLRERENHAFAESAEVHGNLYGTLRREVKRVLSSGKHVLMDIDVQGAAQFTRAFPDTVTIFVLPPSAEVLLDRLRSRNTETRETLVARMQSALMELQAIQSYEYVIVNDDLDEAVSRVSSIIDAEVNSRERVAGLREQVALLIEKLEHELTNHS